MARAGWAVLLLIASTASAEQPTLGTVLEGAGRWVAAYEQTLGNVVAEEIYEQEVRRGGQHVRSRRVGGGPSTPGRWERGDGESASSYQETSGVVRDRTRAVRHLRSEFLLLRIDDRWHGVRDVMEVQGVEVEERQERLVELFAQDMPTDERLGELRRASARFNLGGIRRTINLPTFPLEVLRTDHQPRFAFERAGAATIAGVRTWKLDFEETERPTLVATRRGEDVPLRGRLWVGLDDGRLLKAEIRTDTAEVESRLVVDYRRQRDGDLWVPTEMSEEYRTTDKVERVTCTATYRRFRRFDVAVEARTVD